MITIFLASTTQAYLRPAELIIEEKPDYVDITYNGILTIEGLEGHAIQLIKTPLPENSEIKTELEEKLEDNYVSIRLSNESNYGNYEILVDGTQPIKFSIGKEIIKANIQYENAQNTLFYTGITTAILGVLLLLTTILLQTEKTKKTARKLRVIGIVLIAIGILIGIYLQVSNWILSTANF